jgi:CDP-paratose 2-epimerase
VELHGFLSYLIKCNLEGRTYNIYGYKGKQVRDNIHSFDVARFIDEFIKAPRVAEVYNLGGGKDNTCSIWRPLRWPSPSRQTHAVHLPGQEPGGRHICYYSDLRKMKAHYPNWGITKSLKDTFEEIVASWEKRQMVS